MATVANLCSLCSTIFSIPWAPREPNESTRATEDEESFYSASEGSGSSGRPAWGSLSLGPGAKDAVWQPVKHHRVPDLKASAEAGCALCSLLFDQIKDSQMGLEPRFCTMLEEATGFAVVSSDLEKGASLEVRPLRLEMSYFQHGQWTSRAAYIPINVGLDILPLTDPSDFCGTTVQDPLRSYKETAEAVAEWSRTCIRDHEECAAINRRISGTGQGRNAQPTRLLDICSLAAEQKVRLCGHNTYLTDNEN
ncbi:hypothetical protein LTR86_010484 [Recurvomyces mirabilis]|nr:hypothetical protein LTR86_010484 [Recurvomyces mirabilis]